MKDFLGYLIVLLAVLVIEVTVAGVSVVAVAAVNVNSKIFMQGRKNSIAKLFTFLLAKNRKEATCHMFSEGLFLLYRFIVQHQANLLTCRLG